VAPKHEQALLYRTVPLQALAYLGTFVGVMVLGVVARSTMSRLAAMVIVATVCVILKRIRAMLHPSSNEGSYGLGSNCICLCPHGDGLKCGIRSRVDSGCERIDLKIDISYA